MVESERQDQRARRLVLRCAAGSCPVAVRAQILVDVASVQIHDHVGRPDDRVSDQREGALVCVPFGLPG